MFLPLDGKWAIDALNESDKSDTATKRSKKAKTSSKTFISPATIALKLLVTWLYFDAGYGKYSDPLKGWTLNAQPLPALDTYVRHTVGARYMYALLGPKGLRYMTPTVVYAEMFCGPIALIGNYLESKSISYSIVILMCFMHIGIAVTMRNTVLLSLVACCAWCIFLPEGVGSDIRLSRKEGDENTSSLGNHAHGRNGSGKLANESDNEIIVTKERSSKSFFQAHGLSALIITAFISGNVWFETMSSHCNQSQKHIWSTLLHNRWNVFVGAEEYVTWEIAPGRLADGSVVDVWSKSDTVLWDMPGAGAPCTSTARAGRWRSFPYLAELDGEDGEALWSYLCRQWDRENGVTDGNNRGDADGNSGRKLLRFNFFMLQADILPNMGFSTTRKRLIHSHDCSSKSNFLGSKEDEKITGNTSDEL